MGNLRSMRRRFRHTQEEYVGARMKAMKDEDNKAGGGGSDSSGAVTGKRVDKFNPHGEFPTSTTIPKTIQNMLDRKAKEEEQRQRGEQTGEGGQGDTATGPVLPGGEGKDQGQAGA